MDYIPNLILNELKSLKIGNLVHMSSYLEDDGIWGIYLGTDNTSKQIVLKFYLLNKKNRNVANKSIGYFKLDNLLQYCYNIKIY